MTGKVTRKDVALKAGVSETIVSYALNGNRYVDKAKKERVLEAARELGYKPNPVARALKGKESRHLLMIADDLVSDYFGSLMKAMDDLVADSGILISMTSDKDNPNFISRIVNWPFDGIFIGSATISNENIQALIDTGMPVVLLSINEYPIFSGNYGLIYTGIKEGAVSAMRLFKEKGRSKIAFADSLKADGGGVNVSGFRYQGYLEALEGGRPIVISNSKDMEEFHSKLIEKYEKTGFDALLCRTDTMAAEAISILKKRGLFIPEDVSVIGFNDSRIARYTDPALTTVGIKRSEIASSALELFSRLRAGLIEGAEELRLETELVIRESV